MQTDPLPGGALSYLPLLYLSPAQGKQVKDRWMGISCQVILLIFEFYTVHLTTKCLITYYQKHHRAFSWLTFESLPVAHNLRPLAAAIAEINGWCKPILCMPFLQTGANLERGVQKPQTIWNWTRTQQNRLNNSHNTTITVIELHGTHYFCFLIYIFFRMIFLHGTWCCVRFGLWVMRRIKESQPVCTFKAVTMSTFHLSIIRTHWILTLSFFCCFT